MRIGIILATILASPLYVWAQFDVGNIPQLAREIVLTSSPANPQPNELIRITASQLQGILNSPVTWTVDGIEQDTRETSIVISAPATGKKMRVTASTDIDDSQAKAEMSIVPIQVDLIVDSNSLVPPLYKGLALPSFGTGFTVSAVVYTNDGTAFLNDKNLSFTWKKDGVTLKSKSGLGKSTLSIPGPLLQSAYTVSVDITQKGVPYASAHTTVSPIESIPTLYIDNPRYGIRFTNALPNTFMVPDTEARVRAIPFYADARTADDTSLLYQWYINGVATKKDTAHASAVKIQSNVSSTTIHLIIGHAKDILFGIDQLWDVIIRPTVQTNRATIYSDPFHPSQ